MSRHDDRERERIEESVKATEAFRSRVFVGVGGKSFEEALDNAWAVAEREGVRSGTSFRVLEHTGHGVNPFTDHRVVIVPTG